MDPKQIGIADAALRQECSPPAVLIADSGQRQTRRVHAWRSWQTSPA